LNLPKKEGNDQDMGRRTNVGGNEPMAGTLYSGGPSKKRWMVKESRFLSKEIVIHTANSKKKRSTG